MPLANYITVILKVLAYLQELSLLKNIHFSVVSAWYYLQYMKMTYAWSCLFDSLFFENALCTTVWYLKESRSWQKRSGAAPRVHLYRWSHVFCTETSDLSSPPPPTSFLLRLDWLALRYISIAFNSFVQRKYFFKIWSGCFKISIKSISSVLHTE